MNQVRKTGRMNIRPIQWHLGKYWSHEDSLHKRIPVPESLHCHLGWWGCHFHLKEGVPLHPNKVDVQMVTDASEFGWGAHCQGQMIQGTWDDTEVRWHVNIKELQTILIAMRQFSQLIRDKTVLVLCDNSTAVSYVEKQGGLRSHQLYTTTFLIYTLAERLHVDLQVRHVAGALNVIADRLSRKGTKIKSEWSLHLVTFKAICETLGTPQIDLFATSENNRLPLYVSPIIDDNAYAVDALSLNWTGFDAYAFPPSQLLTKILRKITLQPCKLTIVAPLWVRAVWLWDLIHLSTARPLKIRPKIRLLAQRADVISGQMVFENFSKYSMWNLHVWTLDLTPHSSKTKWWHNFQSRKLLAPADFCASQEFHGSFAQQIAFWLDTGLVG